MKFWLVSFLILFFGAEAIQWFAHLHWFSEVELSLPAVVTGGIGLAISSNYRQLQALGLFAETCSPAELSSGAESASVPSKSQEFHPAASAPGETSTAGKKENSISFDIRKPKPVSFEIRKSRKS